MKLRFLCLGFLLIAGPAKAAEDDVYLFDALARANYRAAYTGLIKKAMVPDWVRDVLRTGDGVATPHTAVSLKGKDYRLDHVCKVNDCEGNAMAVLFAPHGQKAWAAFTDKNGAPTYLGAPSPDIQNVLATALK